MNEYVIPWSSLQYSLLSTYHRTKSICNIKENFFPCDMFHYCIFTLWRVFGYNAVFALFEVDNIIGCVRPKLNWIFPTENDYLNCAPNKNVQKCSLKCTHWQMHRVSLTAPGKYIAFLPKTDDPFACGLKKCHHSSLQISNDNYLQTRMTPFLTPLAVRSYDFGKNALYLPDAVRLVPFSCQRV